VGSLKEALVVFRASRGALKAFVIGSALGVVAPAAEAGYTAVVKPRSKMQASHEQILERVYGGNFVADASGLSFSNESGVTVTRLTDDSSASEHWAGRSISAKAVAAFSERRKTAAYFGATTGARVQEFLHPTGRRFNVNGASAAEMPADAVLVFSTGSRKPKVFSSVASTNRDGMDHAVTYEVKGTAHPASVYLQCWEDRFARRSDRDDNDFVVEIQAGEVGRTPFSQPLLIPLPPAVWTGLSGFAGLSLFAWIRRRPVARS